MNDWNDTLMGCLQSLTNFSQEAPGHLSNQKQLAFTLLGVPFGQQLLDKQAGFAESRAAAAWFHLPPWFQNG